MSSSSIQTTYNAIAKNFSSTRNRPWEEFEEFAKFLQMKSKVLDIGCGNGRLYNFLKKFHVDYTGIDLSDKLLEEAKKTHPDILFLHDDMRILKSVQGEKFDVIFLIASFHHLDSEKDRIQSLEKIASVLHDDGIVCMTNWNLFQKKYKKYVWKAVFRSLFSQWKWNDTFIPFTWAGSTTWRYYHAFTPSELKKLFTKTRWEIVSEFYYDKNQPVEKWNESRNICHILRKNLQQK